MARVTLLAPVLVAEDGRSSEKGVREGPNS